jgi:ATPase involved in DNA repair
MRPLTLAFEHFGPYRQRQDIDFSTLDEFFLIYGKTGSGKTTIFDAIAYALYGEAVGGRSNLERELASRFSPAGSRPWVEFEFFASSARWKVYRSLPYRKQNRKGKESEATGEVALYRMNEAGTYELLADRPTTANQTLLGLCA